MGEDKSPALEIIGLVKKYGDLIAVNALNLTVGRGMIYGLLGPNGSGKTTTIRAICGLTLPTSGEIRVLGDKMPNKATMKSVGYMPQETALYQELTLHQNILLFGEIYGLDKSEIASRENELLEFVDLSQWRNKPVRQLSGGMRHRGSLACSMIHNPLLLILDEPTVGVDPLLRDSFWQYFNKLKTSGITIIITTHYMDEADRCDRVGLLREGVLIDEDTPENVKNKNGAKSLEEAFLKLTSKEAVK